MRHQLMECVFKHANRFSSFPQPILSYRVVSYCIICWLYLFRPLTLRHTPSYQSYPVQTLCNWLQLTPKAPHLTLISLPLNHMKTDLPELQGEPIDIAVEKCRIAADSLGKLRREWVWLTCNVNSFHLMHSMHYAAAADRLHKEDAFTVHPYLPCNVCIAFLHRDSTVLNLFCSLPHLFCSVLFCSLLFCSLPHLFFSFLFPLSSFLLWFTLPYSVC